MKALLLPALLGVCVLPLTAETAPWIGYVTYAPGPVATSVAVQDADWAYLNEVTQALPVESTLSLGRRDADHEISVTRKGTGWLLQISDLSHQFHLQARVDAKTGLMTVEKGVDWAGSDRNADADRAARMSLGYLERARKALDVFASGTMAMASNPSGAEFWQRLVDGNQRFVSGRVLHPNQSMARLDATAGGQKPFAIVVACSDSRVPPEILFDQGIGDLFVIRTAGEVVTEVELGSIEYAVEHLGASFIVVLGHERCGAVDATLKGGDLPRNIEAIAAQIRPAVEAARFLKGDVLDNAVRENAKVVLAKIKGDPIIAEAFHAGELNLKAAYYDLDTGKVTSLP